MAEKEPDENEEKETIQGSSSKSFHLARIVTAFWLLGLCNNYIYVIMLSAAHDIIHRVESRVCRYLNFTCKEQCFSF